MQGARVEPGISKPLPWRSRPVVRNVVAIVETLVLTIVLFVGAQTFVVQPFKVQMTSMESTLQPEDFVLVDKLTPRVSPYHQGDIVVFEPPATWSDGRRVPYIKRVIGVPGDRVELVDGKVRVNGVELEEAYVHSTRGTRDATEPEPGGASSWVVPDGSLFVMGDNRQASADSRVFGPIDVSNVIGRALLRYWPIEAFGTLPT